MKPMPLLALTFSALLLAGCAGTSGKAPQSAGGATAAEATGDSAIAANVQKALAADPETKGLKISADSTQGRVRLKGEARSVAVFQRISAIARSVPGVTSVDNQVVVCMTCQ